MRNTIVRLLKFFITPVFILTLLVGLIYLTSHQNLRMGANDPQIQIAEDLANQLASGQTSIDYINTAGSVDIKKTLAPFVLVYDDAGNILASTGKLDGQNPVLPSGVLEATKVLKEDKITWQPQEDLRFALVVVRYEGDHPGFVVVARSLRNVEQRERMLALEVFLVWLGGVFGLLGLFVLQEVIYQKE